jgi:hypothetical protein
MTTFFAGRQLSRAADGPPENKKAVLEDRLLQAPAVNRPGAAYPPEISAGPWQNSLIR